MQPTPASSRDPIARLLRWRAPRALAKAAGLAVALAAAPAACHAQQQAMAAAGMGSTAAAPAGALRLSLSPEMHMVFEPKPFRPAAPFDPALPPAQTHVGLEFKSAAPAQGARNLLRVQLSGDSMLHFRPRAGGMQVTYKSNF